MLDSEGAFVTMHSMKPLLSIEQKYRIWITIGVVLPILSVIAAMVLCWNKFVFATDLALFLVGYVLAALGVTIGYHRMLTHEGFQSPSWLRALFLILGVMSFEGSPDVWAATHIKHHACSDEEGDPHSPLDGFWHAHMGWVFHFYNFQDAEKYEIGRASCRERV